MSKRIYVDMDGVLCDYVASLTAAKEKYPQLPFPQSLPGFFLNMAAIDGAIETVNRLRESFDVWALTAPAVQNPLCYTEKRLWIENHFDLDFAHRTIISPNKSLLKGDYLIDDHATGRGQDRFEGQLIHFGTPAFSNWNMVSDYFFTNTSTSKNR